MDMLGIIENIEEEKLVGNSMVVINYQLIRVLLIPAKYMLDVG